MRDYLLLLFFLVFFLLLFLGVLNQCRAWALCDRERQFLLPSFSPSSPYRSRPLPQQQVQGSPQQEQGSPPQSDDGVGYGDWELGEFACTINSNFFLPLLLSWHASALISTLVS
ncbi:hypothetical protein K457DRAFT_130807 [Linnemannia elongata AG-77]|uniref:Uncharacterized protein n=1 Tax=Linnemannia elongata AG-77 TaxID=1314771 RepID=A0A197JD79_9FUNG|nr:hypothetical protein K457DRAFT_130807 [Linnemannia elongata AG-77]